MFPGVFEWVWDLGHVIFMGIFWVVMIVLFSGIAVVFVRTVNSLNEQNGDDLDELPEG